MSSVFSRFREGQQAAQRQAVTPEPNTSHSGSPAGSPAQRPATPSNLNTTTIVPFNSPPRPALHRRPFSDLDDHSYTPRSTKVARSAAVVICARHELPRDALSDFVELGSDAKFLDLKAHLLKSDQERQKLSNILQLRNSATKKMLEGRAMIILMSPNLTALVTDLYEHVCNYAKVHPDAFNVPESLVKDHELFGELCHMLSNALGSQRSRMKQRFDDYESVPRSSGSQAAKHSIDKLATSLAPKIAHVGEVHLGRLAFLRAAYLDFKMRPADMRRPSAGASEQEDSAEPITTGDDAEDTTAEGSSSSRRFRDTEFFNYVDWQLQELREHLVANVPFQDRAKTLRAFYEDALDKDREKYRGEKTNPSQLGHPPRWQEDLEMALVW
ncbi:unnamed protein product [Peniophora sp. CBMAI 1063]|nr:unnamed protein product [Peniophora sp. CBMAI 1063]